MRTLPLSIAAVLVFTSLAQAGPLAPAQLPSDAKWVLHCDLEAVRAGDLGQAWRKAIESREGYKEKVAKISEKIGLDPTKDLLGFTVYDNKYVRHSGVVLIQVKRADRKKMLAMLKKKAPDHKTEKYGKRTLYTWTHKDRHHAHHHGRHRHRHKEGARQARGQKDGDRHKDGKHHQRGGKKREHTVTGCFANDNTIVISGNAAATKAALDVIDGKKKSLAKNAALVAGIPTGAMMFARAVDIDAEAIKKARCPVLGHCKSVTAVWYEKDGDLNARYVLNTLSKERAKSFKTIFDGFKALAALRIGKEEHGKMLLGGLKSKAKGTTVTFSFNAGTGDILAAVRAAVKRGQDKWRKKKGNLPGVPDGLPKL